LTCDHTALAILHIVNDLTCVTNRIIIIIILTLDTLSMKTAKIFIMFECILLFLHKILVIIEIYMSRLILRKINTIKFITF
jgi:hypothetical protein